MGASIDLGANDEASAGENAFLGDGGEMGRLIRAYDWAKSPIGRPATWPQSLRTAVRLMLTSRHPMFIWWGPELIQLYNDAYRQTMGPERHPWALGARGRDCWAEIWPIIGPQIELVMHGEGSTWNEDHLVPVTRHGALQEVWWTYGYSPIDDEGGVGGVLVVCNDVTEQHLAKEALARANARLLGDVGRLRDLFGQAPGFIAVLRGPEHVFEFTNAAYDRLIGSSGAAGKRLTDVLPEVESQGFVTLLDDVFKSGKAHVGTSVPLALQRASDGPADQLHVDFVYQPIRDASGTVTGIFVEGYDVTARVAAEHRQTLLVNEMHHRVKNILATVQALAILTGKSANSVSEFTAKFGDRVKAMARTHDVLMRGHCDEVAARNVIEAELKPYLGPQVELTCAPLSVGSAASVSLSLIVHELLTNAAKYGALSSSQRNTVGIVRAVSWRREAHLAGESARPHARRDQGRIWDTSDRTPGAGFRRQRRARIVADRNARNHHLHPETVSRPQRTGTTACGQNLVAPGLVLWF